MFRRLVFLSFVLAFGLMTSAQAKTIIWVSDNKTPTGGVPADQGWVDLLRTTGYTVDYTNVTVNTGYWNNIDADAAKLAALNAADLIIVSRDLNSGSYTNNATEVLRWNTDIKKPVLCLMAHMARSAGTLDRWRWLSTTATQHDATPTLQAVATAHPIFSGVTLDASNQVNILTSNSSISNPTSAGNGTLIATQAGTGQVWIAEWPPGVEFYTGSGYTTGALRMLFCAGGIGPDGRYNLTSEGEKLFLNAVAYMSGYVQVKATNPTPGKSVGVDADSVSLTWKAGGFAALHDIYFSSSFNDVNTATSSDPMGSDKVYKARQSGTKYPPGPFDTMPVTRGTTYYWRIDEVNDLHPDKLWRGNIWSFTVVPNLNWNPNPAHQATFVPVTTDLSWSKGAKAKKGHIIYLSTDFTIVNGKVPGNMSQPGYVGWTQPETVTTIAVPGDLLYNTTYYWRADPVETTSPLLVHKGLVWEFKTTVPGTGSILREIWQNITPTGTAISLLYNWPDFPDNPTISDTLTEFATDPDWDQYGGRIHGWVYAPVSGDYRFCLTSDDNGELWLSTDEDPANAQLIAWESGSRTLYNWVSTGEEASVPIPLVGGKKYYISALWKERGGGDHCAVGWTGPGITSITVIPGRYLMPYVQYWAWEPIPANEAYGVSKTPTLDWLAGDYAASHDVYFGTVYAHVKAGTDGTFKGNQPLADHDYVPSPALTAAKIYYWKITEVNNAHPDKNWEGPVWAFRVAGGAGGLSGAYYQHTGDASPPGFETFKLSRVDPEINFNWGAGSPDPLVDINDFSSRWTGQVEAQFSEDYIFYTLVDDGERLWVDGQLAIDQWVQGATPEYVSAPIPLVAGQKYDIVMEQYENEGGAGAQLRWSSPSTPKRIIPPMWLWPPTKATNPVPPDGSTGAPPQQPTLSWTAGVYAAAAAGHRVYFDADEQKVIDRVACQVNGTSTTNPSYLLPWTFGLEETYYWAVDEVNNLHPANIWRGDTWSFTTANNKVVDDMELYPPNVPDANIYQVWIDGSGDCGSIPGNNTGALVDIATLSALAPVHGGQQAMKLVYDNDGTVDNPCPPGGQTARLTYSKVEALVAQLPSGIGSDWTVGGAAKSLSLWFYGDPLNSIEPMWVQLTDALNHKATVRYTKYADEDINDVNEASWHEWLIDLEDFNVPPTPVNVKNVKSIAIYVGYEVGPAGGSGTLYFDDIRLYTPRCVLTRRSADFAALDYAPAGNPDGDCVIDYRELELMTQDWLLNDYNVAGDANLINFPTDGSQWVAGKKNNALNFDGINDLVYAERIYLPRNAFSVAMWINPRIDLGPTTRRMDLIYWGAGNRPHLTFNKGTAGEIALWPNTGAADFDGPQTITTSWTANTWYHIAATFNGTDFKIYANGVLEGTVNHPGTHSAASGPRIGSNNAGANNFDGRIDDFRIYAYALPDSDVAKLANQTGEPAAGPLFWFKFDETSGGIAHESVGTLIYIPLPRPAIDLYGDGIVNFKDYAVLLTRWLDEDLYP